MRLIEFDNKNANQIYLDYIERVKRTTKALSDKDREDILMELNSYIYEYIQENKENGEMSNLLAIIKRIGAPEEILPPVIANKKMDQATHTFNPMHVIKALSLNISNGLSYVAFSILYLLLFCFSFLAIAKIFFPGNIGVFKGENRFYIGLFSDSTIEGTQELLGFWFIPVVLLLSICLYFLITFLMRIRQRFKK
ncbi:putative membrane protein [Parabacteroides sp. PFB2-12]|uniref:HAAS signaling domain-containing protein n=1 Tax=unclassified Parabacteroides TaxID=2649774 RepID=UPI00247667B3|nr:MULTISPECIES: DUF1700 domain-containing protein [unclassified Parabacteroides]MDH6342150.1 putative membrane protein [Parabacteroides sp. PM6-13]MDH6389569.1 putative membrane protein [Parabacteroides sp. PFB2-12]